MNINLNECIEILKNVNASKREIALLRILKSEDEWRLLDKIEKQKKRKFVIQYLESRSEKKVELNYEKNIVDLYDLGNEILGKINSLSSDILLRLKILISIEQEFINECNINKLDKIRNVDIDILTNLMTEIKSVAFNYFISLRLELYINILEKVWYHSKK